MRNTLKQYCSWGQLNYEVEIIGIVRSYSGIQSREVEGYNQWPEESALSLGITITRVKLDVVILAIWLEVWTKVTICVGTHMVGHELQTKPMPDRHWLLYTALSGWSHWALRRSISSCRNEIQAESWLELLCEVQYVTAKFYIHRKDKFTQDLFYITQQVILQGYRYCINVTCNADL